MIIERFAKIAQNMATEGMVLLKNKENVLPVKKNEVVSLFGRCQLDYYSSGTGSGGAVNVLYTVNALEGLQNAEVSLNEELVSIYKEFVKNNPFDNGGGGWAQEPWFQKEMEVTEELVQEAYKKSDKAVVIIGRTAGEDKDNVLEQGSYYLTDTEKDLLIKVTKTFEDVVVVFNVGNIIDMSFVDSLGDQVKSILYAWHGGQEGGNALGRILSGETSPSGKLSGTIAKTVDDYPSNKNFGDPKVNFYEEDIYVGYRYFETFKRNRVLYPFGFGLSYTTFKTTLLSSTKNEKEVIVEVEVWNTGNNDGKEVVQLYVEASQGKLGKPFVSLVGFGKTKTLKPNAKEVLTIKVPIERFGSYDDGGYTGYKSAYVLEEGHYTVYFGNNVRDLNHALSFELNELVVLEQLDEALAPVQDFKRMIPGNRLDSGEYEITYQSVPTRMIDLEKRIQNNLPNNIEYTGDLGIKLSDVVNGESSMEEFIAQLDVEQLALMIRGEGMSHPLVTPGTAAAFGGLYQEIREFGIPSACVADGPSGIRMDSGEVATQMPIGSLIACSWNVELMEELYTCEGEELHLNKIDSLLGPGLNIHRHPLNGRNFEYFSEDPLVSGLFTKASVLGMRTGGSEGTLKHFVANDQETERNHVDTVASERCLREIHLKGFEIAVKEANARSIMTAYNPINGIQAASNYDLSTTILRKEWNYQGIVMTDWWALMNDNVTGGESSRLYTGYLVRAQNDVYMVNPTHRGKGNTMGDNTVESINKGEIQIGELQRNVMNLLEFIIQAPVMERGFDEIHITKVAPKTTEVETTSVDEDHVFDTLENKDSWITVEKEGTYCIMVDTQYNDSPIAQSMFNFTLNDTYIGTVQMNGRGEHWATQLVGNVHLLPGDYKMSVFYHQPGLKVGTIRIKQV